MPLARQFMSEDENLVMVHRDTLRDSLMTLADEGLITTLMGGLARTLLFNDHSVIVCAWNMEPGDRELWELVASETGAFLEWYDVRDPEVARLIPPMAGWVPAALQSARDCM